MQNTSKVQQGQNIIDKTLELTGSVESLLDIAIQNNVSITDEVAIGAELQAKIVVKKGVVAELQQQDIATKMSQIIDLGIPKEIGIGKMKIGTTFKVK